MREDLQRQLDQIDGDIRANRSERNSQLARCEKIIEGLNNEHRELLSIRQGILEEMDEARADKRAEIRECADTVARATHIRPLSETAREPRKGWTP